MVDQQQITVSIRTTKAGWDHVIKLIQKDTDPVWSQFNLGLIKIIQDTVNNATAVQQNTHAQETYSDEDDTPESQGYYMGEDGRYHNEDYFNETFGGYANFQRLSEEADDMGFPDAETYQSWLDD
jgi:hypothetical protein